MHVDVAVVGAGFVGCALACALRKRGFFVGLIEKNPTLSKDNRVFALAVDTVSFLENTLQLGPFLKGPIHDIHLSFSSSKKTFSFSQKDIGQPALGYLVQSQDLLTLLSQQRQMAPFFCPDTVSALSVEKDHICVTLTSGKRITASLLVGADGKYSGIRDMLSPQIFAHTFNQKAFVCTLQHDTPQYTAYEHFFPKGSLAILPMANNKSAIVWIDAPEMMPTLCAYTSEELVYQIKNILPFSINPVSVVDTPSVFPLQALLSCPCIFQRIILLSDAAQVLHPLIGQGLNLGLREAMRLYHYILSYKKMGIDYGLKTHLSTQDHRIPKVLMTGLTSGLVYGLSMYNSTMLWRLLCAGMRLPFMRRWVTRKASFGFS